MVKWKQSVSKPFRVTRGTHQGSTLSPKFFNIFIDGLLRQLDQANCGVRIGRTKINSFAFADDVTLISSTVSGLQSLINICYDYANNWEFSFGHSKSKCLITGDSKLFSSRHSTLPSYWTLGDRSLDTVDELEILGVTFCSDARYASHVKKRCAASRRAIFRYANAGMSYPGMDPPTKTYLWKTVGIPSLTYGMNCIFLSKDNISQLESTQGSIIKWCLG